MLSDMIFYFGAFSDIDFRQNTELFFPRMQRNAFSSRKTRLAMRRQKTMFSISLKVRDCASLIFLRERQRKRKRERDTIIMKERKKALSYRSTSQDFLLLLRRFKLCVVFCVETRRNRCEKKRMPRISIARPIFH